MVYFLFITFFPLFKLGENCGKLIVRLPYYHQNKIESSPFGQKSLGRKPLGRTLRWAERYVGPSSNGPSATLGRIPLDQLVKPLTFFNFVLQNSGKTSLKNIFF